MTTPATWIGRTVLLLLSALLLTACGESAGESSQAGNELAAKTATEPNEASAPTSKSTGTATEPATESTTPVPESPIYIATAPAGESIRKNIPAGPAPTAPDMPPEDSRFDSDGNGRYSYDELERAIAAEAEEPEYEFPPNYQTSVALMMKQWEPFKDGGAGWEIGMEIATLANFHTCAWEFTWLDAYADGDEALMQESLDQLRSVGLEAPSNAGIRDHMAEEYNRAALGDPAPIQQHVRQSCLIKWATPEAGTPIALLNH